MKRPSGRRAASSITRQVVVASAVAILPAAPLGAQATVDSTPRTGSATARPADRWVGADKVKHLFLGGFTTAVAFSGARVVGAGRRPALGAAVGVAAAVSIGKEMRDRRVTGRFSGRDLVADAVGALAYGALLARTSR